MEEKIDSKSGENEKNGKDVIDTKRSLLLVAFSDTILYAHITGLSYMR